ncbi:MAG: hypothetical protein ACM3S0_09050 [Acidobacteriota bacterium]
MKSLEHEQARYYLHMGYEDLTEAEQESLERHLSQCGTCRSYAGEADKVRSTLSSVMHAQWDRHRPAPATDDKIQTRIRRKIVQKKVMNLTGSLASGAALLGFIVVIAWFFRPPLPGPVNTGSASVPTRVNLTFGKTITLLGFGLTQDHLTAGDTLGIALFWQARVTPQTSYAVFIHLQDENDRLLVQSDALPLNGTRPTTGWKPDEVIEDRREIQLPSNLPPGRYRLIVGLYDPSTGSRLNTSEGKDALTLTTLEVK